MTWKNYFFYRYAGAIVHCLCTDEFTGPKCDIPIPNSTALGMYFLFDKNDDH